MVSTPGTGLPLGAGIDAKNAKEIHLDVGFVSSDLRLGLVALERVDDLDLVNEGANDRDVSGVRKQFIRLSDGIGKSKDSAPFPRFHSAP